MLATFCGYQGHLLSRRAPKAGAVDSETLMAQSLLQPLEAAEAAVLGLSEQSRVVWIKGLGQNW